MPKIPDAMIEKAASMLGVSKEEAAEMAQQMMMQQMKAGGMALPQAPAAGVPSGGGGDAVPTRTGDVAEGAWAGWVLLVAFAVCVTLCLELFVW